VSTPLRSVVCTPLVWGKRAPHNAQVRDERVQVWVVDDQASFRLATAAAVAATKDFVIAGECETGESAIELLPDGGAGIVLMDIHMPGMGGIEATRRIRAAHPDLMVLLMSTYDVEDLPAGAADCGAAAYLHKEHLSPDLLTRLWREAS
jgi:two-component system, NarL family, invasion response regulator UvrY